MLVVRTFEIALDRAESVGDAMRRARSGLAAVDEAAAPLRIFMSDTLTGASKGCARVVKSFPELARLACVVEGVQILSSFDENVPGSREHPESALAPERAQKLADGVPRSFPLNDSHFYFGPVAALLGSRALPPPAPLRRSGMPHIELVPGEVAILSQWWITRRRTRLFVSAREALPPADATELPPVADEVAALLAATGAVKRERRRLDPSTDAERDAIARQVADAEARLGALKTDWARAIGFPHSVEPDAGGGGFLPLREVLAATLSARGYRQRRSARPGGMWILTKRTARRNELELRLDRGPINGRLSARLILCGPLWRHDLGGIPLAPDQPEVAVASDASARRALANLAEAVAVAESILVPPLEEIHGDGFAWLTAVTGLT